MTEEKAVPISVIDKKIKDLQDFIDHGDYYDDLRDDVVESDIPKAQIRMLEDLKKEAE
jgi:hypothetical protein